MCLCVLLQARLPCARRWCADVSSCVCSMIEKQCPSRGCFCSSLTGRCSQALPHTGDALGFGSHDIMVFL